MYKLKIYLPYGNKIEVLTSDYKSKLAEFALKDLDCKDWELFDLKGELLLSQHVDYKDYLN